MVYATHTIVGNLSDFRNLDFLVPDPYPDDFQLPKTLVFHDNLNKCTATAVYLNDRLLKENQQSIQENQQSIQENQQSTVNETT